MLREECAGPSVKKKKKEICLKLKKLASGAATARCPLIAQALRSPARPSEIDISLVACSLVCSRLVYDLRGGKKKLLMHKTVLPFVIKPLKSRDFILSNAAQLHLSIFTHEALFNFIIYAFKAHHVMMISSALMMAPI